MARLCSKTCTAGGALALLLLSRTGCADVALGAGALSAGGSLALTTDYIYRGVSQSDGHGAAQADLHLSEGGSFGGVWLSSRDSSLEPDANAVLELYLGQRLELGTGWGAFVSGRARYYLNSSQYEPSDDYQEVAVGVNYLDRWSFSLTAIPNAVRYWVYTRLGRAPAYVADTSAQWLIGGHVLLTGGAGYYYSSGTGSGIERATGYAYGNVGAGYERGPWRLDVGYFLTQPAARRSFPYPIANEHVAATLSVRF